jgi:hypothetical protein
VAAARSRAAGGSNPTPSSTTSSTTSGPSRSARSRTVVASACLAALASASCATRNTSVSRSRSRRSWSSQATSVFQPVRSASFASCWRRAGSSPALSSPGAVAAPAGPLGLEGRLALLRRGRASQVVQGRDLAAGRPK